MQATKHNKWNQIARECAFIALFLMSLLPCIAQQNTTDTTNSHVIQSSMLQLLKGEQISNVVRKIFQDSKGNIWFGSQDGVHRYDGSSLVYIDNIKNQYGKGVTVRDIAEDKSGNIWFGHTGGVSKFDGTTYTNYSEKDGICHTDVWRITIDHNDLLWIGTLQGVCYFDGNKFTTFDLPVAKQDTTKGVSSGKIVHCITEDSKGQLWFGTNGGAYIYDGKSLSNILEKEGLKNVSQILEDHKGNIWIGTWHNGLFRFDGKTITNFNEHQGFKCPEIWILQLDNAGNLIVTGKNCGLFIYDGNSLQHFTEKDGIASAGLMTVLMDKAGNLWCGGVSGVFRLEGKSFVNVTKQGPWLR